MLKQNEILEIFKSCKALLKGHFLLTSGLHSDTYLEKFQVLQYPKYTSLLCRELSDRFKSTKVDVVVGPVTGGIILAHEVGKNLDTRSIFTERENGKMALRRGFQIAENERVLIVEDVVTTGGSVKEVIEVIKEKKGDIVGIGILIDRSSGKADFGFRKEALVTLAIENYPPENCPMCKNNIPLTKRGSRKI